MANDSALTPIEFPWVQPEIPDNLPESSGDELKDFMPAWEALLKGDPPDVSQLMPSEATIQGLVGTDLSAVDAGIEATLDGLFDSGAIERGTPQEAAARTLLGIKGIQAKLGAVVGLRKGFFDALSRMLGSGIGAFRAAQENGMSRVEAQNRIYDNRASTASGLTNTKAGVFFQEQNLRLNNAKMKHDITNDEWRLILLLRGQDMDAAIATANGRNMLGSGASLVNIPPLDMPRRPEDFKVPTDKDIYDENIPDLPDLLDTTTPTV